MILPGDTIRTARGTFRIDARVDFDTVRSGSTEIGCVELIEILDFEHLCDRALSWFDGMGHAHACDEAYYRARPGCGCWQLSGHPLAPQPFADRGPRLPEQGSPEADREMFQREAHERADRAKFG